MPVGALIGSAAVGTAGSIYAGNRAASAQRHAGQQAADSQLQASREANALQERMFNQNLELQAPWHAAGTQALGQLQGFLGLPSTAGAKPMGGVGQQSPPHGPRGETQGPTPHPSPSVGPMSQNPFALRPGADSGLMHMMQSTLPNGAYAVSGGSYRAPGGAVGARAIGTIDPSTLPVAMGPTPIRKLPPNPHIQERLYGGPVERGQLYSVAEDGRPETFVPNRGKPQMLSEPGVMRAQQSGTVLPNPVNRPTSAQPFTQANTGGSGGAMQTDPYGNPGGTMYPGGTPNFNEAAQPPMQAGSMPTPTQPQQVSPQASLDAFRESINYDFTRQEGENALMRMLARQGQVNSGRGMRAAMDLGQNMAHERAIMPYMGQLNAMAGYGQNAAMQGGQMGMYAGGQMGQNIMGAGAAQAGAHMNAGHARTGAYQNTGNALSNMVNQGMQIYGMHRAGFFNPGGP